jgi:iron complex outermembrane receptor protein
MSIRRLVNGCTPVLAVFPAMLCSAFAEAQSVREKSLPVVVVTGTRFEQGLTDDPVRTTVVTADEIMRSGARTLVDVIGQQTGVQLIDNSGNPNRQIDLRGFGMTGDQNTLILLDGQRITENELASADLASIPVESVERIEIIRGSGAVSYGRGATGGTINIITKKNTQGTAGAKLGLTAGSFNTRGASASANIAQGLFGLSIFADKNDSDNFRLNNQSRQENLTASLTYRGERGPISLRYSSGHQDLRLPGERTERQLLTDRRSAATPNNFMDLTSSRLSIGTEQKLGFGTFAIDIARRERESTAFFDYGSPLYNVFSFTRSAADSVSPRLRIPFSTGPVQQALVVGLDWDRWTWNSTDPKGSASPMDIAQSTQSNEAVYLRHTLDLPTGSSFAIGARQQRVSTEISEINRYGNASLSGSQNRSLSAYELAFRQYIGERLTVHARAGTSFRVMTVDEMRGFGSPLRLLEPQTSEDIDLGIRRDSARGFIGVSVFRMRLNNEIHLFGLTGNVNLPPTERRGIEFEGKWAASDTVSLQGNMTLTDAKFVSGMVNGENVAGKNIPLVPSRKAGVSLVWSTDDKTNLTLRTTYIGEAWLDNDQNNNSIHRRPAYTISDLVLLRDAGEWRLRLSALNLFDKQYYSYAIEAPGRSGYNAYPAPGRTLLMTIERKF